MQYNAEMLGLTEPTNDLCVTCKTSYARPGEIRCAGCIAIGAQWGTIRSHLDAWIVRMMERAGVGRLERQSTIAGILAPVRDALKVGTLNDRWTGTATHANLRGFGFSGGAGSGKTGALAALFEFSHRMKLLRDGPKMGNAALAEWLLWLSWPEIVNRLRVASTRDGGLRDVQGWVDKWAAIPALVLDDLGAEREKAYTDDWAGSLLDLVIDARYRNGRPIWYTTNLAPKAFATRYGARLYSRLCGLNPMIALATAPDARVRRPS